MVLEIVRQAVEIKLKCHTESPLISEAEYCCACGEGLRILGDPEGLLEKVREMGSVLEVKEVVLPVFKEAMEKYEEDPRKKRLFHLLVHSRVKGEITEEIRVLFDPE